MATPKTDPPAARSPAPPGWATLPKLSELVRQRLDVALIQQHVPGVTLSDVMAEAEHQLVELEDDLAAAGGWAQAPDTQGYDNKVKRLCERRRDTLAYLGRPETADQTREHCARVTCLVRCMTLPADLLATLVTRPDTFLQRHKKRLDGLLPNGIQAGHVRRYLIETISRFEKALARASEVYDALACALDRVAPALRERWMATSGDAERYAALKRELADVQAKAEFFGADGGSMADLAGSLRDRAAALRAKAQADSDARLDDLRVRVRRGEFDALARVAETIEADPDRFPPDALREIRMAAYGAMAAIDPLPFACMTTEWPDGVDDASSP